MNRFPIGVLVAGIGRVHQKNHGKFEPFAFMNRHEPYAAGPFYRDVEIVNLLTRIHGVGDGIQKYGYGLIHFVTLTGEFEEIVVEFGKLRD